MRSLPLCIRRRRTLVVRPQQLLLLTTRLQVDRFARGEISDARRTLGGAADVSALLAVHPQFAICNFVFFFKIGVRQCRALDFSKVFWKAMETCSIF